MPARIPDLAALGIDKVKTHRVPQNHVQITVPQSPERGT
jgi:hypothetical protein